MSKKNGGVAHYKLTYSYVTSGELAASAVYSNSGDRDYMIFYLFCMLYYIFEHLFLPL